MKSAQIIFVILASFITLNYAHALNSLRPVNANVKSISYDQQSLTLRISGDLPNGCAVMPQPTLAFVDDSSPLVLGVTAYQFNDVCAATIGTSYDLAFDVRSLKFNIADLNLNPNAAYKIVSQDNSFALSFDFKDVPFTLPYASDVVNGKLALIDSEDTYVLVTNDQILEVNSPIIDLSHLLGERVEVQGHILKLRLSGTSLIKKESSPSSILVTGINTTSY